MRIVNWDLALTDRVESIRENGGAVKGLSEYYDEREDPRVYAIELFEKDAYSEVKLSLYHRIRLLRLIRKGKHRGYWARRGYVCISYRDLSENQKAYIRNCIYLGTSWQWEKLPWS